MSLELKNLNYIYNEGTPMESHALKDINLTIRDGEFVGLIGHTGSGKSTLTQHLNALLEATSGEYYYNGENVYGENFSKKELRRKVGLVFQYPEHQLFEVDVLTDVCFGPKNLGLSEEEARSRAKEALKMVGMGENYYEKSPFDLSGGEKRRVAIAGVLAMHPEVLILDEPTAGLDPKGRDEILDEIAKLQKEQHMTVILVSHSMEDVATYVDRLIVMYQSGILFDDTPKAVFRHRKEMEEAHLAVPQMSELMRMLKEKGIDLGEDIITVAEAKDAIMKRWKEKNGSGR
ncbi:MAG: energy-coupling factor transporter ATPase [Lachnospiraceae bacterium]|nr:energy-coupling factor transporter ATPase [Lachnospiraceae bacterium]